ncbi:hypothetical protein Tco_0156262 [Tanacetum coccineum]
MFDSRLMLMYYAPEVILLIPEAVAPERVSTVTFSRQLTIMHHHLYWELFPPPEKGICQSLLSGIYKVKLDDVGGTSSGLGIRRIPSLCTNSISADGDHAKSAAITSTELNYALSGFVLRVLLDEITAYRYGLGFNKIPRIEFLINKLGMRSFTPDTLKQLADEVDE